MDSHARDIARLEAQLAESRAALAATLTAGTAVVTAVSADSSVAAVSVGAIAMAAENLPNSSGSALDGAAQPVESRAALAAPLTAPEVADVTVGSDVALMGGAVAPADSSVAAVSVGAIAMAAENLPNSSGSELDGAAGPPPGYIASFAGLVATSDGANAAGVVLSGGPTVASTPPSGAPNMHVGVIANGGQIISDPSDSPQAVSADGGSDANASSNGSLDAEDLAVAGGTPDSTRGAINMRTVLGGSGADGLSLHDEDSSILSNTQLARHRRMLAVQQSMIGDQAAALVDVQRAQLHMHESLAAQAQITAAQHAEDMAGIRALLASIASGGTSAPLPSAPATPPSVVPAPAAARRVTMFGPSGLRVESVPEGRGEGGRAPADLPTYNGELVGGSQARFEADFRRATALLGPRERAHYARAALRGIAKQKMDNKFATLGVPADAIVDLDYFFQLLRATVTQHGQAHLTITAALKVKQTATGAASTAFENARDKFSEAGVPLQCPVGTDPALVQAYDRLMITVHHNMLQPAVQSELLRSPELFEGSFAAYQDQAVAIADSIRSQRSSGAGVHSVDVDSDASAAAAASMSGQWQQVTYAGSAGGGSRGGGVPRMSPAIYRAPWSDCAGWAACSPHVTKCNYCCNHSDPRISARRHCGH